MTSFARLARYPRVLFAALRARRRIRAAGALSPEEAAAFVRDCRWYRDTLRATQSPEEIVWLLDKLRRDPPRTVLEIGMDQGGTLFLWTRVAADDALLVAVDNRPLGALGKYSPFAIVRRGLARSRQKVKLVMPADSHDPATLARVGRALEDRPVDFLFIDADHSYDAVKRDYEMYSPLVRPGGVVGFHDVAPLHFEGVARFWAELKATEETDEIVGSEGLRYGIGVVRVKAR